MYIDKNIPIEEYEGYFATRDYWDCCGAEYKYTSIEKKIFELASFVQAGGNLERAIAKYAEDREETYRNVIQYSVMEYITKLMGSEVYVRVMLLRRDEFVKLLSELLKVGAEVVRKYKRIDSRYYDYLEWELKKVKDDSILVAIEEEHKRKHPDETLEDQQKWIKFWKEESLW